ncbi:hypothetical protein [Pantoea sp. CCBC3-3-1]|uniref:hypothetical protein n=1 Tax=Pantoea sp. CCBC3-3-1 TaxID=2490851 RepID=UPI0011BECAD7|nr:hypothetical protein [Pantoea sp. CCBC3-3-1]
MFYEFIKENWCILVVFLKEHWFISGVLLVALVSFVYKFRDIYRTHAQFNNVVISLCAIFTILWGGYVFDVLHQRDKAEADLVELTNRIRDTEATFFNVDVKVVRIDDVFYINPVVKIKNNSNKRIYVKLKKESLTVSRVASDGAKQVAMKIYHPNYYEELALLDSKDKNGKKAENIPLYDISVPVSAERSLSYLVSTKKAGMYYVTFSAQAMDEKGVPITKLINGKKSIWFSSSYIEVKK